MVRLCRWVEWQQNNHLSYRFLKDQALSTPLPSVPNYFFGCMNDGPSEFDRILMKHLILCFDERNNTLCTSVSSERKEMAISTPLFMWRLSFAHIRPLLPALHPWISLLWRAIFGLVIKSPPLQWFLPPPTLFLLQSIILPRHFLDPYISPSYWSQWDTVFNLQIPTWLDLSFNSIESFVGNWLLLMKSFWCSISCQRILGVVVEVWTKKHLFCFISSRFILAPLISMPNEFGPYIEHSSLTTPDNLWTHIQNLPNLKSIVCKTTNT